MPRQIDPRHAEVRGVLRVIGPATAVVGLIFLVVGVGDFFASFGAFGGPPRYFWCVFVGIPLLGLGLALSKFAFLGAITRYMAGEVAPVGKDTFNYMAEGTKEGVRELASAVGEGLRGDARSEAAPIVECPQCRVENEASANFCKACGAPLRRTKACPACGENSDADARFCDHCGRGFVGGAP